MKPVSGNESFYDFAKLGELKAKAAGDPGSDEAIKKVSQQFEAMFLQMMMKSMRDATPKGGLFDSAHTETFEQMHDQQLVMGLSETGAVGIGNMVEQFIRRSIGARDTANQSLGNSFFSLQKDNEIGFPLNSESDTFSISEESTRQFLLNRARLKLGGTE